MSKLCTLTLNGRAPSVVTLTAAVAFVMAICFGLV